MKDGIESLNPLGLSKVWVPIKFQLISPTPKIGNNSTGTSTDTPHDVRKIEGITDNKSVVEKDNKISDNEFKKLVDFYF